MSAGLGILTRDLAANQTRLLRLDQQMLLLNRIRAGLPASSSLP